MADWDTQIACSKDVRDRFRQVHKKVELHKDEFRLTTNDILTELMDVWEEYEG